MPQIKTNITDIIIISFIEYLILAILFNVNQ